MWEDGFCNVERGRAMAMAPTYAQCMNMNHHVNQCNASSVNNSGHNAMMGAFDMNGHDHHHEAPVWRSFRKMSIQLYNYGEG